MNRLRLNYRTDWLAISHNIDRPWKKSRNSEIEIYSGFCPSTNLPVGIFRRRGCGCRRSKSPSGRGYREARLFLLPWQLESTFSSGERPRLAGELTIGRVLKGYLTRKAAKLQGDQVLHLAGVDDVSKGCFWFLSTVLWLAVSSWKIKEGILKSNSR